MLAVRPVSRADASARPDRLGGDAARGRFDRLALDGLQDEVHEGQPAGRVRRSRRARGMIEVAELRVEVGMDERDVHASLIAGVALASVIPERMTDCCCCSTSWPRGCIAARAPAS